MAEAPTRPSSSTMTSGRQPRARMHPLLKIAIALGVLVVLGYLFMRSLHDARSEPYTVNREHLRGWAVVLEPASNSSVMLALRPTRELVPGLFHQVFTRAMESLTMATDAAIPLIMRGEYDRAFAGRTTPDALAAAARNAGLESAPLEPRCLGYRRLSEPRAPRQVYFALFDAPAFARFREQIASGAAAADFDPAALSPVLFIAGSDDMFRRWLPLRANPASDCVAPIAIH